jgi:hypothetical protein
MMLTVAMFCAAMPVRLAAPGMNAVNISPQEAALHAEVFAQKLERRGFEVVASRDVQMLLGLERSKELMGCGEASASCITELAGALGVEGLLVGDIGRLPDAYAVNAKVLSASTGKPLARFSGRVGTSAELPGLLERAAWDLASQVSRELHRPELLPRDKPPLEEGSSGKWWALAPAAVTVAAGVVGAVLVGEQAREFQGLDMSTSLGEAQAAQQRGVGFRTGTAVAFSVAGAGAVATVLVLLLAGNGPVQPTVSVSPAGASLGMAGVFP